MAMRDGDYTDADSLSALLAMRGSIDQISVEVRLLAAHLRLEQALFNPFEPRLPAGQTGGGRWTDDPSSGYGELLHPVGEPGKPGYPIDIAEEEKNGGHTIERHVGKPKQYLIARITGSRLNIPGIFGLTKYGDLRAGSFPSLEAANKLISSTISQNRAAIDAFVAEKGLLARNAMEVEAAFGSPTGYEAWAPDHAPTLRYAPHMRSELDWCVTPRWRRAFASTRLGQHMGIR